MVWAIFRKRCKIGGRLVLTRMWANAQPDGRPAEHSWRPLSNAAVWLTPTTDAVQQRCLDAKPVESCRGAPNSPTDLSR